MYNIYLYGAPARSCTAKFLIIMKLSFLFLIIPLIQVTASSKAQTITLNKQKASISAVFEEIMMQTDYDFSYSEQQISKVGLITISVVRASITEVLDKCFKGQPLTYSIKGKNIIIAAKKTSLFQRLADKFSNIDIQGTIVDETGSPLVGASIKIKGSTTSIRTDHRGNFFMQNVAEDAILVISYIGYETLEIKASENIGTIKLGVKAGQLEEVNVSTGYQTLDKEKAVGSYIQLDNKLINRSVSTNILDRLDGIASGLIFNKNVNTNSNPSMLTIRGRSTIYANPNPLIVIDNFPYNGDLSSINPNDVESITILKDAAAASIWGAFSGNGVVVITTKKGKSNQAPKVEINSSITVGDMPDLRYAPQLSPSHFIEVERFLFDKGYYNAAITSTSYPVLSPIVDILVQRKNNLISASDSASLIDSYKTQDSRDEMSRYFYRQLVNQQYHLNISGGSQNNTYYFGASYNKDLSELKGNAFNRISINASDSYSFFDKKLQLTNSVYFTKSKTINNGLNSLPYPYLKLKDQNGKSLSVPFLNRQGYIDTVGHGNLLDWSYRPIDELNSNNNTTRLSDYRINSRLQYNILTGLNATIQYQYDQANSVRKVFYGGNSYYTRNYINRFTQFDPSTNVYTRPVPLGAILDNFNQKIISQNIRGQISYSNQWNAVHELAVLAGYEVRDITGDNASNRLYGFNDSGSSGLIDYTTNYTLFNNAGISRIEPNNSVNGTSNRYRSYFANLSYTFSGKYVLSASGRKDESNVFGVSTNQKGVPLWSIGGSWEINKESFYHSKWLPYLRLRITNGYQGNVDNTLSSLVTATVTGVVNSYNVPYSNLLNPPNAFLRWEKVNTTNLGVDFSISHFMKGSFEYYIKKGSDLIGISNIDPTTGFSIFKGNSANMTGKGFDVVLNSQNLNGAIKWNTTLLFSRTKDKITKYTLKPASVSDALSASLNPIEGNPLYSLYSLKWGGLSPLGNPQIYLDGKLSEDYANIIYSPDLSNLKYEGPANPTIFGSFRNDFSFKQLTLSVNIAYKFGYYFRRPAINYSNLFEGSINFSDTDYINRWQNAGDELKTNVPVMNYPANSVKDAVYRFSSILIDKGDHIRVQDISLAYEFTKKQIPGLPFNRVELYGYINNIGILWRANKNGIDPDYLPNEALIYPNPRMYSLGLRVGI